MIRAPGVACVHAKVDDHMDAEIMQKTKAHKHDYVKERGLFYDHPNQKKNKEKKKFVVHHGRSSGGKGTITLDSDRSVAIDTNGAAKPLGSDLEDVVSQLMERLRDRDADVERLEAKLAHHNDQRNWEDNSRSHSSALSEGEDVGSPNNMPVQRVRERGAYKSTPKQKTETDHDMKTATVSCQTDHTGEINDSMQRKRIRGLKRELRKERHSKELLSLISISSSRQQQRAKLGFQTLPWHATTGGDSSLQIEHHVERLYYQRVRLLLDAHAAELAKVKSESEKSIASLQDHSDRGARKLSHLRRRCREMASTIFACRRAVEESQAKAVAVCQEALHELEMERKESEARNELASAQALENTRLAQNLKETSRALAEMKQEKQDSRANYERVLSVLNASAQSAAAKSTLSVAAFERSLSPLDFETGLSRRRFSASRPRPAGI
jgi:hypothetical protein